MDSTKTKSSLAKAPLVYIEWVDAVADCEWQDNVKAEIHLCRTIGWVVAESDEAICIANTVSMESSNARMHIPTSWIRNKKELDIETIISEGKGKSTTAGSKRPSNRKV
jgi:hypothetical protein